MIEKIAILGTGTIGSSVGADLVKAGYDAVLIDQWPAHVEAMKTRGLRILMEKEEIHVPVKALHLSELCTVNEPFGLVLLAAKSYDTRWLVEFIKPHLKREGVLVSLQNSMNDEWIAPVIGYERDIASVVELSGELFEPGVVRRNTDRSHTWFALGELHGRITPRLREIAQILKSAGVAEMTTNIWGVKWSKLVANCMNQAVCGILGTYNWELVDKPDCFRFCIRLGREALEVAEKLGYDIEPLFGMTKEDFLGATDHVLEKHLMTLFSNIGKRSRCAVLQDHLKGRRSEVDYLNGLVVKKGREAGVPTPFNEAVVALTHQIEQGGLKPHLSNFGLLEKLTKADAV